MELKVLLNVDPGGTFLMHRFVCESWFDPVDVSDVGDVNENIFLWGKNKVGKKLLILPFSFVSLIIDC